METPNTAIIMPQQQEAILDSSSQWDTSTIQEI